MLGGRFAPRDHVLQVAPGGLEGRLLLRGPHQARDPMPGPQELPDERNLDLARRAHDEDSHAHSAGGADDSPRPTATTYPVATAAAKAIQPIAGVQSPASPSQLSRAYAPWPTTASPPTPAA